MYYCTLTSGRSIYHAARARVRCGPRTYVRSDRNARLLVNKVSHRQAQCMVEWSGYPLPLGRFRSKVTTLTGSFCRFVQSSLKRTRSELVKDMGGGGIFSAAPVENQVTPLVPLCLPFKSKSCPALPARMHTSIADARTDRRVREFLYRRPHGHGFFILFLFLRQRSIDLGLGIDTPSIPINQVVLDKISVKHWECKS
jgi:hypothetical protein